MEESIHFSRKNFKEFFIVLNQRVNNYFEKNHKKKTGDWRLHIKAFIMFAILLSPYFLLLFVDMSNWLRLLMCVCMGVGMAGVGMNVMHDGNHGSYSSLNWVNKLMGSSIYFLAGNVYNWQVQHNVIHHTYTNIQDKDEDLESSGIMRFSPQAQWKPFHRYQHLYFLFFYGLLTFNWAITKDFKQMKRYTDQGLYYGKKQSKISNWIILIITKLIYFTIWLAIPIWFVDVAWWQVLLGFFIMHFVAGLILSVVFQLAHVVDEAENPEPGPDGILDHSWAAHQLMTTVNFGMKNPIVTWFTGGLNFQIEHHIFSKISHIHYPQIAKIVEQTAREYNLPYHTHTKTRDAIRSHYKFLKELAMPPA